MFIRAYRNVTKGRIEFLASIYDMSWKDTRTGERWSIGDTYEAIGADLEFLNWRTGRSPYNERGRLV